MVAHEFQQRFGEVLQASRKHAHLSIRRLAMNVGMDGTYLSKVERGILPPPSWEKVISIVRELRSEELIDLVGKHASEELRKTTEDSLGIVASTIAGLPPSIFSDEHWRERMIALARFCLSSLRMHSRRAKPEGHKPTPRGRSRRSG